MIKRAVRLAGTLINDFLNTRMRLAGCKRGLGCASCGASTVRFRPVAVTPIVRNPKPEIGRKRIGCL